MSNRLWRDACFGGPPKRRPLFRELACRECGDPGIGWSGRRVRIRPCRASFRVWACKATRNAWRGGELPRLERPSRARPPYACSGCPEPVRFGVGKMQVGQFLEHLRVIAGGVMVGDLDFAPALQRSERHEYVGHAVALVL